MEKICQVIEFSCPADVNVLRKVEERVSAYDPLIRNLQIIYKDYRFKIIPAVVGALGNIPNTTKESQKKMKFSKIEINKLLRKLQKNSVRGTLNVSKTFFKFSKSKCMVVIVAEYYPAQSQLDNVEATLSKPFF